MEDLAYRRLLDLYYLNEQAFNGCSADVARDIGMTENLPEVEYVLSKYFTNDDGEWFNNRCEKDIKAYKNKKQAASKAGKASAKARQNRQSERTLNNNSTDVQPTNNHKPITSNDEPIKKKGVKRFTPPSLDEVKAYILEKQYDIDGQYFIDFYESKGWMIGKNKMKDWKATIRGWQARNKKGNCNGQNQRQSKAKQFSEKLDEITRRDIEENGIPTDSTSVGSADI